MEFDTVQNLSRAEMATDSRTVVTGPRPQVLADALNAVHSLLVSNNTRGKHIASACLPFPLYEVWDFLKAESVFALCPTDSKTYEVQNGVGLTGTFVLDTEEWTFIIHNFYYQENPNWQGKLTYELTRLQPRIPFIVVAGTLTVNRVKHDESTFIEWTTNLNKECDAI
jgi:hypothetical protein